MAPEALLHHTFSPATDVWAFGVTLWEIITGEEPFASMSSVQAAVEVLRNQMRLKIPENSPPVLGDLIRACLEDDPEKRPTFVDIVEYLQERQVSLKF
jgi:serine/threonine protein kinase